MVSTPTRPTQVDSFVGKIATLFLSSMSERSYKRKCSLQDSLVDLSKVKVALHRLHEFEEELDGIQETDWIRSTCRRLLTFNIPRGKIIKIVFSLFSHRSQQ